jgi:Rieske Fe-S protein
VSVNRRHFVALTVIALAGCNGGGDHSAAPEAPVGPGGAVDAGPATDFANDGVYGQFRKQGFFVVQRGGKLSVLSSFCTHRHCKLKAEPDQSFLCPCHGSVFDPAGKVMHGPAVRDLPTLPSSIDSAGHLIVHI